VGIRADQVTRSCRVRPSNRLYLATFEPLFHDWPSPKFLTEKEKKMRLAGNQKTGPRTHTTETKEENRKVAGTVLGSCVRISGATPSSPAPDAQVRTSVPMAGAAYVVAAGDLPPAPGLAASSSICNGNDVGDQGASGRPPSIPRNRRKRRGAAMPMGFPTPLFRRDPKNGDTRFNRCPAKSTAKAAAVNSSQPERAQLFFLFYILFDCKVFHFLHNSYSGWVRTCACCDAHSLLLRGYLFFSGI